MSLEVSRQKVLDAQSELRDATEVLIEHSGDGWPITPAEVAACQARWDDACSALVDAAMIHAKETVMSVVA